jgi:peroxiredoxin
MTISRSVAFVFAAVAATATASSGVALADAGAPLALGAKAPLVTTKLKNVDGKEVSIAQSAGKEGTLVVFTCNHCPFAKAWEQRIAELGNSYVKRGIGVILINANDPTAHEEDGYTEMQAHAKNRAMQFPYAVDETSAVARAFGASVTPEAFLFDKAGKLAYHGAIDDSKDSEKVQKRYLKDALDAIVGGRTPAVPESKSIGCGIKFRKAA